MSGTKIVALDAWEVLDSRGSPTVACEVRLDGGARGTASVPSGASTGSHEAHELRDGGDRFGGRGVQRAVANICTEIADALRGEDAEDQVAVDAQLREIDGTPQLSRLGANATLAVSVANAIALASSRGAPLWSVLGSPPLLPLPMVNIISGGAHAGELIDLQDLLVVPTGARSFHQAIEWSWRVRQSTAELAREEGLQVALVADEGGIAAQFPTNRAALELLLRGIERSGLVPGGEVAIAIDVAATQLARGDGRYELRSEGRVLDAGELVAELAGWCEAFPIVSLEDVLGEDDWPGWAHANELLGRGQLIGDDLFVTDLVRLERGITEAAANAVLVKPNQTGTLSDAGRVLKRAQQAGMATVVSARSGETEDSWLADLAVGWRSGQIKVGSTTRSERTAKWNRLLRIENELGDDVEYASLPATLGRQQDS
jgi:enolase